MRIRIATLSFLLTLSATACEPESELGTSEEQLDALFFRGLVECGINCDQRASETYLKGGEDFREDTVIQQAVIEEVHAEIGEIGCGELGFAYAAPEQVDPDGWDISDVIREDPHNEAVWWVEVTPPQELGILCEDGRV